MKSNADELKINELNEQYNVLIKTSMSDRQCISEELQINMYHSRHDTKY